MADRQSRAKQENTKMTLPWTRALRLKSSPSSHEEVSELKVSHAPKKPMRFTYHIPDDELRTLQGAPKSDLYSRDRFLRLAIVYFDFDPKPSIGLWNSADKMTINGNEWVSVKITSSKNQQDWLDNHTELEMQME